MKIIIASHEFPPRIGGAGVVAKDLAKDLCLIDCDVTVVTSYQASFKEFASGKIKYSVEEGIDMVRIPVFSKMWFLSYPWLLIKSFPYSPDLLVFNDFAIGYRFDKAKLTSNVKIIQFLHGKEKYLLYSGLLKSKFLNFDSVFKHNLNTSDKIICVSNFIKDWLLSIDVVKNTSKVKVLNNKIDKDEFGVVDSIPEEYDLKLTENVIVSASRLVKLKGYESMLAIFEELTSRNKDFTWIVIGDGDFKSEFERIVLEKKLKNVIYIGRVERNKLKYYYAQADVFWLLSEYEEAFPLVYHEARECGLPTIGMDKGGVSEVITDSVDGYVCTSYDEVFNILNRGDYKNLLIKGSNDKIGDYAKSLLSIANEGVNDD